MALRTMATREGKFGTFGGVYTPSLLTILGVILYLRLPMVVGEAGLINALGIILVAHVISVATGLSISSIATDKSVGAGGPYYIVSRSLGLPIGGTLGLALFLGLSFSISLYVIGFSESFLSYWGFSTSVDTIRVCGTITIVAIMAVTFISTALAIKSQYVILTLIALSLASVFFGAPDPAVTAPHLHPAAGGKSLAELFGIFFPAVTGFTAGVNMSGDLTDPKKSIPRGTMAAIGTGMVVYVGLALFVGTRVPPTGLTDNPNILLEVAAFPPFVVAGIWGATVSSALGSILGAPRILQAVARDGIMPRFLARGYGKTHEPRNALLFAFAIGEAGILIGDLDAIARIVSMVFLATYGFLNVSCAIESWASPDFRPEFRIPKSVSGVGAITCVIVMIQLDLLAMVGAVGLMVGIFVWLQRRELRLESGDTWEGIWSSLARAGLSRLGRVDRQQRNWRPNVVSFSSTEAGAGLASIAESLLGRNGLLTYVDLVSPEPGNKAARPTSDVAEAQKHGIFRRRLVSKDHYADVVNVCRFHGLTGLEPNTLLLDWESYGDDPQRLASLLGEVAGSDVNQLIYRDAQASTSATPRIDVWWREGGGNLPLAVSLIRFLTASSRFERATIRLLLLSSDPANNDVLRTTTRRYLAGTRVDATIRVVNTTLEARSFEEWVRRESADATLAILSLPNAAGEGDADFLSRMTRLFHHTGPTLLVRQNSTFAEVLSADRPASGSLLPPALSPEASVELPPVELPKTPDLARHAAELAEAYRKLVLNFDEDCVARVYGRNIELVRRVKRALEKQLSQMDKGFSKANVRRKQHIVNRAQSSFLLEAAQLLEEFEQRGLREQQATLEARIEVFLNADAVTRRDDSELLTVERPRSDFARDDSDSPAVASMKRRARWSSPFGSGPLRYRIPVGHLQAYYFDGAVRVLLKDTVTRMVADAHQLAVHLGKLLSSSKTSLILAAEELTEDHDEETTLEEQRQRVVRTFDDLVHHHKARVEQHRARLFDQTAMLVDAYSRDVERFDVVRLVHKERRRPVDWQELRADLEGVAPKFVESQKHLFDRAALAVRVAGFQHRFVTATARQKEALVLRLKNGAASDCQAVHKTLTEFAALLKSTSDNDVARPKFSLELDNRVEPKDVIETLTTEASTIANELPETVQTLSDESIQALEEGRLDDVEIIDLSVRRLALFLVDTEIVGPVGALVQTLPDLERRVVTLAQDVVRLVTFQLAEFDSLGSAQPGDLATHMLPVVESGLERLEAAGEELDAMTPKLEKTMDGGLEAVVEGTNAYELTHSSDRLEQYIRLHQSKMAVSKAQGLLRGAVGGIRDAMVRTLYQASAGVVLARKLGSGANGNVVDRVLEVVQRFRPHPEIMSALPFYYRQLFLGHALNETFWVAREAQIARARRAIASYRQGSHGAIIVTGAAGSGKSAVIQHIASKLLDERPVYFVQAPRGGSVDPNRFERALATACGTPGTLEEVFALIPEQATIVVDDLELWWERSERGFAVIDRLSSLVQKHGSHILFVFGIGQHVLSAIAKVRRLEDAALSVIECDPLPAEALGKIIMLRHGSTGMKFELGGRSEDELSQWQLARIFSRHFQHSRGSVGAALISWLAHVDKATESKISIRSPELTNRDALDDLRIEQRALLLQLALHKRAHRSRLERITGMSAASLDLELATLSRMGLVRETRGIFELDRFTAHVAVERLEAGGLL